MTERDLPVRRAGNAKRKRQEVFMQQLTADILKELLADHEQPCISLYQPTSRHFTGASEDPIRFKNLMKQAQQMLAQKYAPAQAEPLIAKLQPYQDDGDFWRNQADGLALFCSPDYFRVVHLQRPVDELVVVSDTFHTSPLLRIIQSADRYQVLCISQRKVSLYEGNRYALDEVELRNVPRDIREALGTELRGGDQLTVSSYGMGTEGAAKRHGHGGRKDEQDIDIERYLRAIDRAIWDNHSRASGLPLMLAAVDEYHAMFQNVSHNPNRLPDGIRLNPDWLERDRLRDEAWKVYEPHYRQRIEGTIDQFRTAQAQGAASDNVMQVSEAAAVGRVGTLLVEQGRQIGGRFDRTSGKVELGDISNAGVADILDDVAEQVIRTDGQVFIVPPEQMPTGSGIAAIYRY
jgi:hypothetical protein